MTIWLNMIVRNESAKIERCLNSVKELIDHYVIVDTGSTDDTREVIHKCMEGKVGFVLSRPWVNFEHNRNEALAELQREASPDDYILFMDADDELVGVEAVKAALSSPADCYEIEEHDQNLRFLRPLIVRAGLPLAWVGKTHEFLNGSLSRITKQIEGAYRQRGGKTPEQNKAKLERDLDILSSSDTNEPRTCFYLAQTLKDLGRLNEALVMYDKRASLGGWQEEAWWAKYEAAMLKDRLGRPEAEVMFSYQQVFQERPWRAEPLVQLARYCRDRRWFVLAGLFATRGLAIPFPENDRLFIDGDAYRWRLLDEYAISAYYQGHFKKSRDTCKELLCLELPFGDQQRIERNLQFAQAQLGKTE